MSRRVYGIPALPVVPSVRDRDFRNTQRTDYVSVPRRYEPRPDVAASANKNQELYDSFSGEHQSSRLMGLSGLPQGLGENEDLSTELELLSKANIEPVESPDLQAATQVLDSEQAVETLPEVPTEAIRGKALNFGIWAGRDPLVKQARCFEEVTKSAEDWGRLSEPEVMDVEQAVAESVFQSQEALKLIRRGAKVNGAQILDQLGDLESGATVPATSLPGKLTISEKISKLKPQDYVLGAAISYLAYTLLYGSSSNKRKRA